MMERSSFLTEAAENETLVNLGRIAILGWSPITCIRVIWLANGCYDTAIRCAPARSHLNGGSRGGAFVHGTGVGRGSDEELRFAPIIVRMSSPLRMTTALCG
jgi:hypothetical protein